MKRRELFKMTKGNIFLKLRAALFTPKEERNWSDVKELYQPVQLIEEERRIYMDF